MSDWRISSPHNPDWHCDLASCDEEHARSALAVLEEDSACPHDLELVCTRQDPPLEPEHECGGFVSNQYIRDQIGIPVAKPRKWRFWRKG